MAAKEVAAKEDQNNELAPTPVQPDDKNNELAPTPIQPDILFKYLKDHPNQSLVKKLIGFTFGFDIGYIGPQFSNWKNSKEPHYTREEEIAINKKLDDELKAKRIGGPYDTAPFKDFRVSPIFLVPKRVPGEFRFIHNLSHPKGNSINDFIPDEEASVTYAKIDDAIKIMLDKKWKTPYLGKADIKGAFKLLPISKKCQNLLGFKHKGKYFVSKTMPQGCKISCRTFDDFSSALHWCLDSVSGTMCTIHYIDDFLFVCESEIECKRIMDIFEKICADIGVPLVSEKSEGPTRVIIFLGLTIDTIRKCILIPQDKIRDILNDIDSMLLKKRTTLKAVQSIIGSLNFICRACVPGRAFMRRLIDACSGAKMPHHYVRISEGMRADLSLWKVFFRDFNGAAYWLPNDWENNFDIKLFFESTKTGFAVYFNGNWAQELWSKTSTDKYNENFKNLLPLVIAFTLWGNKMHDKRILIHISDEKLIEYVNRTSARDKNIMLLIRYLVLSCLKHNIHLRATFAPNLRAPQFINHLANNNIQLFRDVCPLQKTFQEQIPAEFLPFCRI